jgi:drug/metabolite transporter (DMT)-like permease
VTPVVAVILGMIVLNEEFGWRTLAGGAMIISGIALIVVRTNRYQPIQSVAKT